MSFKHPKNNEERVAKAIAHAIRFNIGYSDRPSYLGIVAAKELRERGLIAPESTPPTGVQQ